MFGWVILMSGGRASAHDLAIDQIMLWPNPGATTLRGEVTFDPELTRSKDTVPTAEYERKVVAFLKANLQISVNGRTVPLSLTVRELWVRGGATVGDLVEVSAPLPPGARELRVFASSAFKALVVSMQRVDASGQVDTTSWLLGRNEWTPVYRLGAGWQEPGWKDGGPDVFWNAAIPNAAAPGVEAAPAGDVAPAPNAVASPNGAVTGSPVPSSPVPSGPIPSNQIPSSPVPDSAVASSAAPAPTPDDAGRTARPGRLAAHFIQLGFEHILPGGIDHMLFVAGLVLGRSRRYRQVLVSLSLFTLAHTVTLALGNFQVLQVPARIVEPLIAFSIFLLGIDNLRSRSESVKQGDAVRYVVVFFFGLVHGLGFASALSALAFGREHVILALLSFNVGVELGQIAVVVVLGCLLFAIRDQRVLVRYATLAGSAAIAASGLFMVFDRLAHGGDAPTSKSETQSCRYEV